MLIKGTADSKLNTAQPLSISDITCMFVFFIKIIYLTNYLLNLDMRFDNSSGSLSFLGSVSISKKR